METTLMEPNLVENWLRRDPIRWISGALAGLFAAIVTMGVAMILSAASGYQTSFPLKLIGTIVLGPDSTDMTYSRGVLIGAVLLILLCVFLGFVFAHFVYTNSIRALSAMGVVWGIFS